MDYDITLFKAVVNEKAIAAIARVLGSGYLGQGKEVESAEQELFPFTQNKNILLTNSCTSALHLAYYLSGVGPGAEVIVAPMTCLATVSPIVQLGGTIVWADIDPISGLISTKSVEEKITSRTRAIVAVDWAGFPCDWRGLSVLGPRVIIDAAHSIGSTVRGETAGQIADFVCYSFQAIKQLTCGDGGGIVCLRAADYDRARKLRWYGLNRDEEADGFRCNQDALEIGFKFNGNDIMAAMLRAQITSLEWSLRRSRYISSVYGDRLKGLEDFCFAPPRIDTISSPWMFPAIVADRDDFHGYMAGKGIQVSPVHRRLDTMSAFAPFTDNLPGVSFFADHQINIPTGSWMTNNQLDKVVNVIRGYRGEAVHVPVEQEWGVWKT